MVMASSDPELNAYLLVELQSIITDVTEEVWKELRSKIQDDVYGAGQPTKYPRQYEAGLLGEWNHDPAQVIGNTINSVIDENPQGMSHDPEHYIHGSFDSDRGDDIRAVLAEIVNEGLSGNRFGDGYWRAKRPFFDEIIAELDMGLVNKLIEDAFNKRGILWVKS